MNIEPVVYEALHRIGLTNQEIVDLLNFIQEEVKFTPITKLPETPIICGSFFPSTVGGLYLTPENKSLTN